MYTETAIANYNKTTTIQIIFRILLGAFLLYTGTGHLTWSRVEFTAQVPKWLPINEDLVVVVSGIVELIMGASLIFLTKYRIQMGWVFAIFFVLVFPGNISQMTHHISALGMDTDFKRELRLVFQPVLIFIALWSTGAWHAWREHRKVMRHV